MSYPKDAPTTLMQVLRPHEPGGRARVARLVVLSIVVPAVVMVTAVVTVLVVLALVDVAPGLLLIGATR